MGYLLLNAPGTLALVERADGRLFDQSSKILLTFSIAYYLLPRHLYKLTSNFLNKETLSPQI